MTNKFNQGKVPLYVDKEASEETKALTALGNHTITLYKEKFANVHLADGLKDIWKLIRATNKFIDEMAPWDLAKKKTEESQIRLHNTLATLAASLRVSALLVSATMPNATMEIFRQLGLNEFLPTYNITNLSMESFPKNVTVISDPTPIFPRVDDEVEIDYLNQQLTVDKKGKGQANKRLSQSIPAFDPTKTKLLVKKPLISLKEFTKADLRVAQIKSVSKIKGAKKLLKFIVDAGDDGDRQIVSGISQSYPNYNQLVGKKVIIVANLKPIKLMGILSQGMILSVVKGDKVVQLVIVDNSLPNGSSLE